MVESTPPLLPLLGLMVPKKSFREWIYYFNMNVMLNRKRGGEKDGRNEGKQQAPLSSFKSIDPRDSPDTRQGSEGRYTV